MGIHEKAWSGLNLVVFGKTPLLPMKLEQALAKASPSNEVRIDSFEDYDQAFDFCKAQKNVGFIFMLENSGNAGAAATFKQLASHYETNGWPAFGALLHEGERTFAGYQAAASQPNFLTYQCVSDFLDPSRCANSVNELWYKFVSAFEASVIPEKLQETLRSLVSSEFGTDDFQFTERATTLLVSQLNISWVENVAIRWSPIVELLKKTTPSALAPNEALVQIATLASSKNRFSDLGQAIRSEGSLCARVSAAIHGLNIARKNGTIESELASLATLSRPGAPALLRRIVLVRDRILSIAHNCNTTEQLNTGVG